MSKRVLPLIICAALLCMAGCGTNNDIEIKSGEYLAGGTIPAEAKIYPIVYEDVKMAVNDENGALSAEDIFTITHYVDVWSTLDDTRGDGFASEQAKEFLTMERIRQLEESMESSEDDYSVDGVQILAIDSIDEAHAVATYVLKLTGYNSNPLSPGEGTYEAVQGLYFERIDGKWYEDGIAYGFMAEAGTIEYIQDETTGHITVSPTGDYY